MAFGTVRTGQLTIERGAEALRSFASSPDADRRFCGHCGTAMFVEDHREPDAVYVSVATLDAPDLAPPGFHIFYAEHIAWAPAADDLPRFDGFRLPPGIG